VGGERLWRELLTQGKLTNGETIDYALGLRLEKFRGQNAISHGGSWAGYRAEMIRFPEQRFTVICLCNLATADPSGRARRVAEAHLAGVLGPAESRAAAKYEFIAVPEEKLKAFEGVYRNPVTGALRRVAVSSGKLTIGGFGPQTTELGAVAPNHFRPVNAPHSSELQFIGPGRLRAQLIVRSENQKPETFESVPPPAANWKPEEFAGDYASDELDTTHRLRAEGGKLVLRIGLAEAQPLEPIFRDAFLVAGAQLVFQRDAQGKLSGYLVQAGRVRNIRFVRRPPAK